MRLMRWFAINRVSQLKPDLRYYLTTYPRPLPSYLSFPHTVSMVTVNFYPLASPPFFTGTSITLTCDVHVPLSISTEINVSVMIEQSYEKDGVRVSSGGRVTTRDLVDFGSVGDTELYRSSITISPLVRTSDTGQWTCRVTLSSDNTFIVSDSFSDNYDFNEVEPPGKREEISSVFLAVSIS